MATISELKRLESIPIIASLNGGSAGQWLNYAKDIEASGADALELNWQPVIANPHEPAAELERQLCDVVHTLSAQVSIPVAVKLNQRFTIVMLTSEIYRAGPEAIRKVVEGINHFLDSSKFDSLQSFLSGRPPVPLTSERLMRMEYVDPLTRSNHYFDPSPVATTQTGDAFGHPRL